MEAESHIYLINQVYQWWYSDNPRLSNDKPGLSNLVALISIEKLGFSRSKVINQVYHLKNQVTQIRYVACSVENAVKAKLP